MTFPFLFLKFWYFEGPKGMVGFFASLNKTFFQLFSTGLLLKTFFKPWKNEYREGLVGFSIGMGIFIKTWIILATLLLFCLLVSTEIAILSAFLFWPFATIWLLFL